MVKLRLIGEKKNRRQKRINEKIAQQQNRARLLKKQEEEFRKSMSSMTGQPIDSVVYEENENSRSYTPRESMGDFGG